MALWELMPLGQIGVGANYRHSAALLLSGLLCAAFPLAQKRSRRPVIGHVLLHGHARNGATDKAIVTASALDEQ